MSEAATGWIFTPPIQRGRHLVRHPGEAWIGQLRQDLRDATGRSDAEAVSVVLNNMAFVLFKAGLAGEAAALCRAHYHRFTRSPNIGVAHLAVQPWINEGRLLLRRGDFAGARQRLLFGLRPEAVVVGGKMLAALDPDTMAVCRNVAAVDGFMLELRAGGLDGAAAHVTRLEQYGVSERPVAEFRLQLALACKRVEEAALILDRMYEHELPVYLPTPACYGAAIALASNDARAFARDVLLLVALLDGWAETEDDIASILHGLQWLSRIAGTSYWSVLGRASHDYLCRKAVELDDEELQCLLAGRRYNPLPEGSHARHLAADLLRDALAALGEDRLAF